MHRKHLADFLVYLVVRVLICIVQAMRIETGRVLAGWLAWLFSSVVRVRVGVVDENLAHALPELSPTQRRRLGRRMWEHLFLLVLEVAHTPRKIHETNWRHYVRLRDEDRLVRLLLSDRPTLIVTAHFGNFELAGYVLAILGFRQLVCPADRLPATRKTNLEQTTPARPQQGTIVVRQRETIRPGSTPARSVRPPPAN